MPPAPFGLVISDALLMSDNSRFLRGELNVVDRFPLSGVRRDGQDLSAGIVFFQKPGDGFEGGRHWRTVVV